MILNTQKTARKPKKTTRNKKQTMLEPYQRKVTNCSVLIRRITGISSLSIQGPQLENPKQLPQCNVENIHLKHRAVEYLSIFYFLATPHQVKFSAANKRAL